MEAGTDANQDGVVDMTDAILIMRMIHQGQ